MSFSATEEVCTILITYAIPCVVSVRCIVVWSESEGKKQREGGSSRVVAGRRACIYLQLRWGLLLVERRWFQFQIQIAWYYYWIIIPMHGAISHGSRAGGRLASGLASALITCVACCCIIALALAAPLKKMLSAFTLRNALSPPKLTSCGWSVPACATLCTCSWIIYLSKLRSTPSTLKGAAAEEVT